MKRGLLRIQCTRCPAFLTAQRLSRDEFAAALEERGWRVLAEKSRAAAICPDCAKKAKAGDLAAPKYASAT